VVPERTGPAPGNAPADARGLSSCQFWPAEVDLRDLAEPNRKRLIGHNPIADMQLLMLAHRHRGRLVTFDAGLRALASGTKYADSLLVLAP
jgi:predicted nucleic acid-binding protein